MNDKHGARATTFSPAKRVPPESEIQALKSDVMKVAKFAQQLGQMVGHLQNQMANTEVNTADVRPQLLALKVHTESLPQALREFRRSQCAMEKTLASMEARLKALEDRVNGALPRL
jgi:septal ring factor EnvC (AmiA/AmiB activator)